MPDLDARELTHAEQLTLRKVLAALYHDDLSIRRIVNDAGLTAHQIALSGSVANLWFAVVDEAQKSGKTGALVTLAFEEYPNRDELKALHAALAVTKAPPTPPQEVPTRAESPSPAAKPAATPMYDPGLPHFSVPFSAKKQSVIGRDDALRKVREQLDKGVPTAIGQTAAFVGLGGLGKTQLAVEYAHAFRGQYPNGVFWITADQALDGQLANLALAARWINPESDPKDQVAVAVQQLRTRSKCLIVFDNVETLDGIKPLLPIPPAAPHLLLTSRAPQPGFERVELHELDDAQSLEMLALESRRTLGNVEDEAAAHRIAGVLGGLPLALELVGA